MSSRYGRRHHELRLRLLPLAYGHPCARCGYIMTKDQALDLDHNDTGVGYKGFSHAKCNRSTNAVGFDRKQPDTRNPRPRSTTQWGTS